MEVIISSILNNPLFSGYLEIIFICAIVFFTTKIRQIEEKFAKYESDQKDDIKDIKDRIISIENNIAKINQNILELAKRG